MQWLTDFINKFHQTMIVDDRYMQILWGLGNTLLITVCAILMGIVIGTIIAMIKAKVFNPRNIVLKVIVKILDVIGSIYLTVIRGTPMILQLMIMYYGGLHCFRYQLRRLCGRSHPYRYFVGR